MVLEIRDKNENSENINIRDLAWLLAIMSMILSMN